MLKLGLLNADLEAAGLPGVDDVRLFRLTDSEKKDFTGALPDLGVLVADLNLINTDSFTFLKNQSDTLTDRLRGGALLICFTSRPNLHSPDGVRNKYSWLPFYDDSKEVREDLVDKIQAGEQGGAVADTLNDLIGSFYATCSFPKGFGTELYEVVLSGEDGVPVGLMKSIEKGCVLLVPQAEDKRAVLERVLGWWESLLKGPGEEKLSKWAEESSPGEKSEPVAEDKPNGEVELETSAEAGAEGEDLASLPIDALTPDSPQTQSHEDDEDDSDLALEGRPELASKNDFATDEPVAVDDSITPEVTSEDESDDEFSAPTDEQPEQAASEESSEPAEGVGSDKYEGAADPFAVADDDMAGVFGSSAESAPEKGAEESGDARDELDALLADAAAADQAAPAPSEETPDDSEPEPVEEPVEPAAAVKPDWLDEIKSRFPILAELSDEAGSLEKQAQELLDKAVELRAKVDTLSSWDALLYEPATRLAETVCEFFERVLGAEAKLAESDTGAPALRVTCGDNDYLIHVATSEEPIGEDAGRDLMRHLADADVDTKGVLIVNGALGNKPQEDPDDDVADKLAKLARKRGLVIVSTQTLYRIGLAAEQEKEWKPGEVLEALADKDGVFKY